MKLQWNSLGALKELKVVMSRSGAGSSIDEVSFRTGRWRK